MADTILQMVEADTGPSRIFTITRSGVVVNLTGKTIKLILKDTSTNTITNTGHQTVNVVSAAAGTAQYDFLAGDIASGNVHLGDLQLTTTASSQVETDFDPVVIYARPKVSTVS